MLDLKRRRPDARVYVAALEGWLIDALAAFGVKGETREDRVGVWVARPDKPPGSTARRRKTRSPPSACASATGRLSTASRSTSPPTSHFGGIVPCGIGEAHYGVTSLADLGRGASMAEVDRALRRAFEARFGATAAAAD